MAYQRDSGNVILRYPERSCLTCGCYPCFEGIENCVCDFAKYGCNLWKQSRKK